MGNYKSNLKAIKEHLKDGETVKQSVFGMFETKILGNDSVRNGVLVATESRIVFYAKKMFGFDLESFPFKNIGSIEQSKGFLGQAIVINSSGNNAKLKWIKQFNGDVPAFVEYVNSNIGQTQNDQIAQDDIPSQIKKLSDLKDQGILTDDEFSAKKAELLSKM